MKSVPTNFLALLATIAFLFCIVAESTAPSYVVHEKRNSLPPGWSHGRKRKLDSTSTFPLRVNLKQSNTAQLSEFLNDVSHPESPNYGKHWTPERVASTFAPSNETVQVVRRWLTGPEGNIGGHRIKLAPSRGWIELNVTVEEAERLLNTEYHLYTHKTGVRHVACTSYHLPEYVAPHVDVITPSVHFNAILDKRSRLPTKKIGEPGAGSVTPVLYRSDIKTLYEALDHCHEQVTPLCLRALYGFYYTPRSTQENGFGIVEYTPQAYLQEDLNMFFTHYSPGLVGQSPVLASIDGGYPQRAFQEFQYNVESNLDLQYAMALVTKKQPVTLYQVGDVYLGASFNNLLDALDPSFCSYKGGDDPIQDGIYPDFVEGGYSGTNACGTLKPTNVISTSYGYNEADLSPAYTARQCDEYGKLGLMGITMLFSSGDNGVAGNAGLCVDSEGTESESGTIFSPGFPIGCPYVTSIGATQIDPGANVTQPESACETVIYSGGGFSNHFSMPEYQKEVVSFYLNAYRPSFPFSDHVWNSTGGSRGFPDFSANGANYVIASNGVFGLVYGTSASAPVVGAMLTMINDARLSIGKSPIGFINPAIYSPQFRSAFNDITKGRNPGCGTNGFSAERGWDPVTGLGTPNFPKLLRKWIDLP